MRDVRKLESFTISELDNLSPENSPYENLEEYIEQLSKNRISERSQARAISSIKAFFKFLVEDDYRTDNPATLLEDPKLGL